MKPGIYSNISNEDYHGGEGISNSGLSLIGSRTPLHFYTAQQARLIAANDNVPTPAQAIGTAFHAIVLEPKLYVQQYTLALRPQDVPDAIQDRDQLVAMVVKLNAERELLAADAIKSRDDLLTMIAFLNTTRLPKLSTSGSKDELISRCLAEQDKLPSHLHFDADALGTMKIAELKTVIEGLNSSRPGLLPTAGSMAEVAATLRGAGEVFELFTEVVAKWEANHVGPFILSEKESMADMACALRLNGIKVSLWSEVKAEWHANNGHRNVVTHEESEQLKGMRDAVMAHPAARALLSAVGAAEQSVYWNDPVTGELCRCRPDFWRQDGVIVDLKSTDDASPEEFARSIAKWRYHVQAPFYVDGVNLAIQQSNSDIAPITAFAFVVCEKKAPYAVAVYVLDAPSMDMGRAEYRRDLNTYAQCKRADKWPGYGERIQNISLPQWKLTKDAALLTAA